MAHITRVKGTFALEADDYNTMTGSFEDPHDVTTWPLIATDFEAACAEAEAKWRIIPKWEQHYDYSFGGEWPRKPRVVYVL